MAYKDLLVELTSYPERTANAGIGQAASVAALLGAHLTAITFEIELPHVANTLARSVLNIDDMVAGERQKSSARARNLVSEFEAAAEQRGISHDRVIEVCQTSEIPDILVDHARLRDLTLVPVGDDSFQQYLAESVIFGSGRPVLILPEAAKREFALKTIAVAWDANRPAARAVADALPLLAMADVVRAITVVDEKPLRARGSSSNLVRHLNHHGIAAVADEVSADNRPVGEVLDSYCQEHDVDLLVMGAYGHSRMRDFILGGATKSILASPVRPVLLAH
ncbi:universal stress protein [Microvirga roseola]|uniref:universal stress protein n=1 Tax=Microvirga roseola TaxID=2883126 RepID=UPI001E2D5AD2|nr:universal stress protein [Microvirga roseola]